MRRSVKKWSKIDPSRNLLLMLCFHITARVLTAPVHIIATIHHNGEVAARKMFHKEIGFASNYIIRILNQTETVWRSDVWMSHKRLPASSTFVRRSMRRIPYFSEKHSTNKPAFPCARRWPIALTMIHHRYVAGAKLDAHFERESAARSPSPSQEPPPTGPSTSATSDIRERKRATPTDPAEVSGSARGKRHVGCLFSCFPSHEFA